MVAFNLDLINENAVEINGDYDITIQMCGTDDLTLYQGICQVKTSLDSTTIMLSPTVQVITKDSFRLYIPFNLYPPTLTPANYIYDVLFYKIDKRFYAVYGKMQVIKRISTV